MNDSDIPCEIYVEKLAVYGHGFPVWMPNPSDSANAAYRNDGVQIGDVGIMTDEYDLDYLFNITVGEEDARNQPYGVPSDFSPLSVPLDHKQITDPFMEPNTYIGEHSVKSVDLQLEQSVSR